MADTESTSSSSEVTVMSAAQVTELITAITGAITELKTAIVTELSAIKTSINSVKTQLDTSTNSLTTSIDNVKTQIATSGSSISSAITVINTKLEDIKDGCTVNTETIETAVTGLIGAVIDVGSKLEIDITPSNLNLEYGSKTGVKTLAYIEASEHVLMLKRLQEAANESSGGSGSGPETGTDESTNESEEAAAVTEDIRENANEIFNELVGYEFNVTDGERISFKTPTAFEESRIGLSFDFTRHYYTESVDVVLNTEVTEYALLVFDSLIKTSGVTGSTDINRMKSWIDLKNIQTVVITKNTISESCTVYFPTQEKFDALDSELYKDEKAARDAIVAKYQELIGDSYKGIAFIPVKDIEPGITLEEYRTAAKNITPTCEYT